MRPLTGGGGNQSVWLREEVGPCNTLFPNPMQDIYDRLAVVFRVIDRCADSAATGGMSIHDYEYEVRKAMQEQGFDTSSEAYNQIHCAYSAAGLMVPHQQPQEESPQHPIGSARFVDNCVFLGRYKHYDLWAQDNGYWVGLYAQECDVEGEYFSGDFGRGVVFRDEGLIEAQRRWKMR